MKNLSPFHSEIVSLLQNKICDQKTVVDADAADPLFLEEIVAKFQHSFDQPDHAHVEAQWMNSFSEKEFTQLRLRKYFPKIYRGLPREYHRDDPGKSRLRKNFTDLARLKNLAIDRAVCSLYEGFIPKSHTRVGIVVWVLSDGLGDWVAAQESARILSTKFPGIQMHLYAITVKTELPPAEFPTTLISYQGAETDQLLSIEQEMDFMLQIPTYFPNSDQLFSKHPMECVGEYGFLDSSWFHPQTAHRSMGLHALEMGIFTRKHPNVTFAQLEHKELLQVLFGTAMPGPTEVEAYERATRFHLGYLATPVGGAIYLHSLLKMWERDEKNIDLCSPDLGWVIQWMEQRAALNKPLIEKSFGLKELEIHWEGRIHRTVFAEKGKVLRIICPGILSFTDMQRLISLSGDWVGVRGNQSLSEAISSGKAFFYDGRDHSKYFMKDLVAMAENRLSGYRTALHAFRAMSQAFLWNLPDDDNTWVDDTHFQQASRPDWFEIATELGLCLQDPDAISGFKKFGLICSEERSVGPFLCHLMQRSLMQAIHPELKETETYLRQLYGAGTIQFSTLVNTLLKKMKEHGSH